MGRERPARRGEARWGEARRGEARRGEVRRGEASGRDFLHGAQEASQVRRRTHSHDEVYAHASHVHTQASICVATAATGTR